MASGTITCIRALAALYTRLTSTNNMHVIISHALETQEAQGLTEDQPPAQGQSGGQEGVGETQG